MKLTIVSLGILFLTACGGSGTKTPATAPPVVNYNPDAEIKVLMMGNSHTTPIPSLLKRINKQVNPGVELEAVLAPGGMFLIDRITDEDNVELVEQGIWTHVVLQALKYSTSGRYSYPTDGAEFFIDKVNANGGTAILFPEHPRRGVSWESNFLYQLHSGVAEEHPACVSPIGFVWEDFMSKSSLDLYMSDGNHASAAGSFLTALVIYQTIMNFDNFNDIPYISSVNVPADQQTLMRASVADIVNSYRPCKFLD